MSAGFYRKKPVVIEAFQLTDDMLDNGRALPEWFSSRVGLDWHFGADCLRIKTLEGEMFAREFDWIIRGVNGELYPCKSDIFEKTYERVEDCVQSGGAS